MAEERAGAFDFRGPRTLVGPELKPGDRAPQFTLVDNNLQEVTLDDFTGKPVVLSAVPSLETSVCSAQTRRFEQEAAALGDTVAFVTVSADLPFAQARWCSAENATNVRTLSDHRDMSFGAAYGTYVKELRIESRAVFVVDAEGTIRYAEYVPSGGQQPNYDAVMATIKEIASA